MSEKTPELDNLPLEKTFDDGKILRLERLEAASGSRQQLRLVLVGSSGSQRVFGGINADQLSNEDLLDSFGSISNTREFTKLNLKAKGRS